MTKKVIPKRRFKVSNNEGSFFYEPWLDDTITNKSYRYDKVPKSIRKLFANELRDIGRMKPDEARMIVEFVLNF